MPDHGKHGAVRLAEFASDVGGAQLRGSQVGPLGGRLLNAGSRNDRSSDISYVRRQRNSGGCDLRPVYALQNLKRSGGTKPLSRDSLPVASDVNGVSSS